MVGMWPYFLPEISCFWKLFYSLWQLKRVENRRFLAKIEAYSVTCWLKMAIFESFLYLATVEES